PAVPRVLPSFPTRRSSDLMKDTSYVINVARGGLIDEDALGRALEDGLIAGAGIDVFVNEPAKDLPFFAHDSATVTPHLGASTEEDRKSTRLNSSHVSISYA